MKKVLCDKLRILEKETHLYKNSPISLDCDAIANSQQPINLYKSMICSFLNNYNGRLVEEPKNYFSVSL
jgi:hypothetical protein